MRSRPKWFTELLEIFEMTEKRYWKTFITMLLIIIVGNIYVYTTWENFFPNFTLGLGEFIFLCNLPFTPFAYHAILYKAFKIVGGGQRGQQLVRTLTSGFSGGAFLLFICAFFGNIIFLIKILRHYYCK